MAFGNATKGYVKAHSGGGGTGTDNYNNLSNKPKINGVALSGNKTSADLHIETGTDDYEDLTNKPSINGVELLGENVIGLLSGNIQVDYTKLTDLPSINGVTLTGNKTSSDLHISGGGGSSDYTELTNKPSINGVELLGDKEVGLLSGNIHIDYSKLTNTPSINGVALSGNKTSADLHIEAGTDDYTDLSNKPSINGVTLSGNKTSADLHITGSGLTTTTIWTNDGTHSDSFNGPLTMSEDITTFDAVKFIFKSNTEYMEQTVPADIITDMIANETSVASSYMSGDNSGQVSSWLYQTTCLVRLNSATTLTFYIMWSNSIVKLKLWQVIGINY